MLVQRLRELLRPSVPDVDTLWSSHCADSGASDVSTFVKGLRDRGLITNEHLRDVLTAVEDPVRVDEPDRAAPGAPRYAHLGPLGKGAMGEVYIARDRELWRKVAVKRMDPAVAEHPDLVRRFHAEVRITAQLDHPAIIPVYDVQTGRDGAVEYAMKLIRGRTLSAYLDEARAFLARGQAAPVDHALAGRLEVFVQVCNALAYAHTRGVLHRDLKPDNVMLGAFHEVTVMDWGIARLIGGDEPLAGVELDPAEGTHTQLGMAIGTAPYMSPEQARGENDVLDGRSDQYALGLILYEIVSLRRAVTGHTAIAMVFRAQSADKDPLVPFGPRERISRGLRAIIDKATALEPDDRYPDVEALADDVRRYLRDEEVLASPDGPTERAQRWIARNRALALATGLGLLLLVFAVAGLGVLTGVAALEAHRYAAAVREERLGDVHALVSRQAHRMDTRFRYYESLLAGLTVAAEHVLAEEPAPRRVYFAEDFVEGRAPSDFGPARAYGLSISLGWPDVKLATGVPLADVERRVHQLASLHPHLYRALLRSHGEAILTRPAQQRGLIRERGVPVVWAYVAVEEGLLVGLPGLGDYPDPYDPRGRPWYLAAKAGLGPRWGAGYIDPNGMGLVLPVSAAVRDAKGGFLGIAALDISIEYIIAELLVPPGLPDDVEVFLVDADGVVVVRSTLAGQARGATSWTPEPFPHPQVVEALGDRAGHIEIAGDEGPLLATWSPLEALDWTYVIVGPSASVLAPR